MGGVHFGLATRFDFGMESMVSGCRFHQRVGSKAPALPAWVLDHYCAWRILCTLDGIGSGSAGNPGSCENAFRKVGAIEVFRRPIFDGDFDFTVSGKAQQTTFAGGQVLLLSITGVAFF